MKIVVACDAFPPIKSSAAEQMKDLVNALLRQGHDVFVFFPKYAEYTKDLESMEKNGAVLIGVNPAYLRHRNLFLRTVGEALLPIRMLFKYLSMRKKIDGATGLIWYSPSIFLCFFTVAFLLKRKTKSYLILRDIFPDWAEDLGVLTSKFPIMVLRIVSSFQFFVATKIGVQSQKCKELLINRYSVSPTKIEILENWMEDIECSEHDINLLKNNPRKQTTVVYAGNMGVAQGLEILHGIFQLNQKLRRFRFFFIGNGSKRKELEDFVVSQRIKDVYFFDPVTPEQIRGVYKDCDIGLVLLSKDHKTNNKPGKFISYLHSSLPICAFINEGNDLKEFVIENKIGFASSSYKTSDLWEGLNNLKDEMNNSIEYKKKLRMVAFKYFSTDNVILKITKTFCE